MGFSYRYMLMAVSIALAVVAGCTGPDQFEKPTEALPVDASLLRVGVSVKAPPLVFKNNRQIVGLEADFARELSTYLGKELVFVELNWKDQIQALIENRIDIVMSGMTITDTRRMRISFSDPYFVSGQMPMIRSADVLKYVTMTRDGKLGYIKNTTGESFIRNFFPGTQKIGFKASEDGVKALIGKKIDILVHDGPVILYLASKYEARGVTPIYKVLTEEYLAWGIRRDNVELKESTNRFLQTIKEDGRLDAIIKKWIPLINRQ